MIEINQVNPISLKYAQMGLPQRNGHVLLDTRSPTILSPDDCNLVVQNSNYQNEERNFPNFLVPSHLLSINFHSSNNLLITQAYEYYVSSLSNSCTKLFSVADTNNFIASFHAVGVESPVSFEEDFLSEVGLIICWFMCHRPVNDEVRITFVVETPEGEILSRKAIMCTIQTKS